jgi:hypothetical protein
MRDYLLAFVLECLVLAIYVPAYIAYCNGLFDVVNVPLNVQVDWTKWTIYMASTYVAMVSASCLGLLAIWKVKPWRRRTLGNKALAWVGSIIMLFLFAHTVFLGIATLYFSI